MVCLGFLPCFFWHIICFFQDNVVPLQSIYGNSSVGRALVSKTRCREFEPLFPCRKYKEDVSGDDVSSFFGSVTNCMGKCYFIQENFLWPFVLFSCGILFARPFPHALHHGADDALEEGGMRLPPLYDGIVH